MIGKPEWFKRRKYSGWGVTPKTWQGWLYIAIVILPFALFQSLPFWDNTTRIAVTVIWVIFLLIDIVDIMIRMKKDERENRHEALAERNALWAIMIILVIGLIYQIMSSSLNNQVIFDPVIVIALIGAVIVKAISNFYMDRKD
jgi:amino acid transporter